MSTLLARQMARCLIIVAALASAGCGTSRLGPDETLSWSPEKLYAEARDELRSGNWASAIKLLEKLESRYPFGRFGQQAQLDIAWAHYREGDQANALANIDRFIRQYPNHAALDYALYLKGLINFNENRGLFARFGGQDLSERDLKAARESFDTFKQLVARFPESRYAADAEARMRYLVNSMATGEVSIARYYYSRGAYVAAVNRAKAVVEQYPQAPAVEDALVILARSYDGLGLVDLRDGAERVLKLNFPDSPAPGRALAERSRRWWQIWK